MSRIASARIRRKSSGSSSINVPLPLPPMAVSATEIRARVAQGQPVDALVPPPVARYIEQHRLYQA